MQVYGRLAGLSVLLRFAAAGVAVRGDEMRMISGRSNAELVCWYDHRAMRPLFGGACLRASVLLPLARLAAKKKA